MKNIIQSIPDANLIIVSDLNGIKYLKELVEKLKIENNVNFVGYTAKPEIYYSQASLFILPSNFEGFPNALFEAKAFGLPNIITGKKYLSLAKEGSIIIDEDNIEWMSKESIKILSNQTYRYIQGKNARKSLKEFHNKSTIKKLKKIISDVYKGKKYIEKLITNYNINISEAVTNKILSHEFLMLIKRNKNLSCRKFDDLL